MNVPLPSDSIVLYLTKKNDERVSLTITATERGATQKMSMIFEADTDFHEMFEIVTQLAFRLACQARELMDGINDTF